MRILRRAGIDVSAKRLVQFSDAFLSSHWILPAVVCDGFSHPLHWQPWLRVFQIHRTWFTALALGLGIIWLVSPFIVRHSAKKIFQNLSTLLKLMLILHSLWALHMVASSDFILPLNGCVSSTALMFAIGLVFVMYSYAGWNAAPTSLKKWATIEVHRAFGGTLIVSYSISPECILYTTSLINCPVNSMSL